MTGRGWFLLFVLSCPVKTNRTFQESTSLSLHNSLHILSTRLSAFQAHKSTLIAQWQSHLSALSTLDSLIHTTESRASDSDAVVKSKEAEVRKAEQRLVRDLKALEKVERPRLSGRERELRDARNKLATLLRLVGNQNSELTILASAMEKGDQSLSELKELGTKRRKGLNELENHVIPSLEDKVAGLQADIESDEQRRAEEERAIEGLEELVDREHKRLNELEGELEKVKEMRECRRRSRWMLVKLTCIGAERAKIDEAEELKTKERRLLTEMSNAESAIGKVETQISEIRKEIEMQEAAAYSHEYASVELRRELRKLKGLDTLSADLEMLGQEIKEFGSTLEEDTGKLVRMREECEVVSKQVGKQRGKLADAEVDLEFSQIGAKELHMDCASLARSVAAKSKERENLLVELAMLRLHLKRLEERKTHKEIDLGDFDERMSSAQMAFDERRVELETEIHRLRTAVSRAEDATSETQKLVASERVALEKLRNRWALLATKLQGLRDRAEVSGETAEVPDEAKLSAESERIKGALAEQVTRQKHELGAVKERLGDEIAEVEGQVARLRVTLTDTKSSSADWRKRMEMQGVPVALVEAKQSLETQLRDAAAFMEGRRAQLRDIENELGELELQIAEAENRKAFADSQLGVEQVRCQKLEKEVSDGSAKLARAKAQVGRSGTAKSGLKLLKEAKQELGDKVLNLINTASEHVDPELVRGWTLALRSAGIAIPETKPRGNGVAKKVVAGRARTPVSPSTSTSRPASPSVVRFPSDADILARSASDEGELPRIPNPAPKARPLVSSLKGSRSTTPVRGTKSNSVSVTGLGVGGSAAGSRGSFPEM
jgi:chromosome segregation ATPase